MSFQASFCSHVVRFTYFGVELSLENAFELRNGEEHVIDFMSRDGAKLVSHLLTLALKASHLVKLVK